MTAAEKLLDSQIQTHEPLPEAERIGKQRLFRVERLGVNMKLVRSS
jgi:hypothetical protein